MSTLFVSNLPAETTEEDLEAIFQQVGDVEEVKFEEDEKLGRYGLVTMSSEKVANRATRQLNGERIDGHSMTITFAELPNQRELTSKQRKTFEAIAEELGETEEAPLAQLHDIVLYCGTGFAQAILDETKEIEAGEGIPTSDGQRRRTPGGVFFYLARFRIPHDFRKVIYYRKKPPEPAS